MNRFRSAHDRGIRPNQDTANVTSSKCHLASNDLRIACKRPTHSALTCIPLNSLGGWPHRSSVRKRLSAAGVGTFDDSHAGSLRAVAPCAWRSDQVRPTPGSRPA